MFTIRPSTTADRSGVRDLILARSDWLEQRGMESWREHRIGTQIAWWALDHAARRGLEWVRRGCYFDGLRTSTANVPAAR